MHMPAGTKFVDEPAMEAEFGFEPGTLFKLRRYGRGPNFYRFGERTVFYEKTEVAAWIEQSKRDAKNRPMAEAPAPAQVTGKGRTTRPSESRVASAALIHDVRALELED